jgi:hypothetical protein
MLEDTAADAGCVWCFGLEGGAVHTCRIWKTTFVQLQVVYVVSALKEELYQICRIRKTTFVRSQVVSVVSALEVEVHESR